MSDVAEVKTHLGLWRITEHMGAITKVWIGEGTVAHPPQTPLQQEACRQIEAYSAGELQQFELPLSPRGPEFHHQVWQILLRIPFGKTTSYGDIAIELGNPQLARAVGQANGKNPIAVLIPCHRVIGKSGQLTGYAGGLSLKQRLLEHEQGLVQPRLTF
ncbi:MAG: methylated-DNA--[protein]-cysteine S-methyltransferase [Chthonomonas sp.]|nr:methylated-DNA--[protein]-cysteine S-methyltransferase [Chthonomonas sp.]